MPVLDTRRPRSDSRLGRRDLVRSRVRHPLCASRDRRGRPGSIPSARARPLPPSGTGAAVGFVLANLTLFVAIIGLAVSGLIWGRGTRQLAEAHGSSGRSYSRHWGTRVFPACVVCSAAIAWLATDRTVPAVLFGQAALRALGAAALIGGVLHSRTRVLRLIAHVNRVVAGHYSPVARQDPAWPLSPTPTSDDWNAGQWDPDVLRDIEARRQPRQNLILRCGRSPACRPLRQGNIKPAIVSARQASKPVRDAYGTQKPFAAPRGR